MFKELISEIGEAINRPQFDPASLDDPVALETSWDPVKRGGNSFRSHVLRSINSNRMEYKASAKNLLIKIVLLSIGLGGLLFFLIHGLWIGDPLVLQRMVFPLLFLGPLVLIGGFGLRAAFTAIVIDKSKNAFWRGREMPTVENPKEPTNNYVRLSDVYALQIIAEQLHSPGNRSHGRNRNQYSFEINFVFKNGRRINLIDYGDLEHIRRDAKTLSAFLSVPVWDSIAGMPRFMF